MSILDWKNHLDQDEDILWQGRPDAANFSLEPSNVFQAIFGTFFAGFALFWMTMASLAGGFFWMFGLLHFGVGAGLVIWSVYGGKFIRQRTWYTLTNCRAFIATQVPIKGRRLSSYPITSGTPIDYIGSTPPSIMFATRSVRSKNGFRAVAIGFEQIHDAAHVQTILRDIQKGDL